MNTEQGRVVIIGGSSGMGRAIALECLERGWRVTVVGRSADKLKAMVGEVGNERLAWSALDASSAEAVDAFSKECGEIEHLVVAAGSVSGACMGPFLELDSGALAEGFSAKFWLHFEVAQRLAPLVNGSITFLTAISAQQGFPGTAGLAAINGAIEAMVRPMAKELAPRIRVNAVSPGVVDTEWWSFLPDEVREQTFDQVGRGLPMGRIGQPHEVARLALGLMESTFTTGVIVPCDGGSHLG